MLTFGFFVCTAVHTNTGAHTQTLLNQSQWEVFDHPPYSLDLGPRDHHLLQCKCDCEHTDAGTMSSWRTELRVRCSLAGTFTKFCLTNMTIAFIRMRTMEKWTVIPLSSINCFPSVFCFFVQPNSTYFQSSPCKRGKFSTSKAFWHIYSSSLDASQWFYQYYVTYQIYFI